MPCAGAAGKLSVERAQQSQQELVGWLLKAQQKGDGRSRRTSAKVRPALGAAAAPGASNGKAAF